VCVCNLDFCDWMKINVMENKDENLEVETEFQKSSVLALFSSRLVSKFIFSFSSYLTISLSATYRYIYLSIICFILIN
jgi:hypothetical protein